MIRIVSILFVIRIISTIMSTGSFHNNNNATTTTNANNNIDNNSNVILIILSIITSTVSFHNFKSQNFKLSVSNPKSKYAAYVSVLSQI